MPIDGKANQIVGAPHHHNSTTLGRIRWGSATDGRLRMFHLYATVHGFTSAVCGRPTKGIRIPDLLTVDARLCTACADVLTGVVREVGQVQT